MTGRPGADSCAAHSYRQVRFGRLLVVSTVRGIRRVSEIGCQLPAAPRTPAARGSYGAGSRVNHWAGASATSDGPLQGSSAKCGGAPPPGCSTRPATRCGASNPKPLQASPEPRETGPPPWRVPRQLTVSRGRLATLRVVLRVPPKLAHAVPSHACARHDQCGPRPSSLPQRPRRELTRGEHGVSAYRCSVETAAGSEKAARGHRSSTPPACL